MRKLKSKKTLIVGIGNSSRTDDALGWKCAQVFSDRKTDVKVEYRFQLNLEDAAYFSEFQQVLLVDSSQHILPDGFKFATVQQKDQLNFSSHQLSPSTIAWLCRDLFHARPEIYLLEIQGYEWTIGEGLSEEAQKNLQKSLSHLENIFD